MKNLVQQANTIFGLQVSPAQIQALKIYERELLDWNSRISLTAIREPQQVRVKHFLDSLSCMLVMRDTPMARVVDVGTGGGFPGLPLKIINPAMQLTLIESVGKKANFCRHIVNTLGLEDVQVLKIRAEELGHLPEHRQQYDWAIARAVAVLPVLAEYLLPLVRIGGVMLAMKGDSGPAESHAAEQAFRVLGGHLRKLVPVTLPGVVEERHLVVVDKTAATPEIYPRRTGMPAKKPL